MTVDMEKKRPAPPEESYRSALKERLACVLDDNSAWDELSLFAEVGIIEINEEGFAELSAATVDTACTLIRFIDLVSMLRDDITAWARS
jgi:hypothetical protein